MNAVSTGVWNHVTDEWVEALRGTAAERADATTRLYELLLRIARSELHRRSPQHRITGPEQDDLAHQAAADALLAVTAKLDQFRGESRFTTWAFKFVMLEVSAKIGRHFWRTATVPLDAEDWDRLPARFGFEPDQRSEWHDLLAALRKAVDEDLTEHQRKLFVAIVLNGIPADALAAELATNRNAIYKTVFDARRKIRANLVANGYLDHDTSGRA
jgi:RNA polymerase sigma-70 factor, ECF subfamily